MNSFNEFLRQNGVSEKIQATAETVSFENANRKKFAYLIDDVEQCLRALWTSGDIVEKLLGNDWTYEESQFRKAFGAAFGKERSNSVVSNLGSQTPNTVRCLELYAYYKLNRTPTAGLEKPDILSSKNLDALFYGSDLTGEFRNWLSNKEKDGKKLSEKSVESYTGAVSGLLSTAAGKNLFRVSSPVVLASLRERILTDGNFIARDNTGNQMYSVALNHYADFLSGRSRESKQEAAMAASQSILTEFSKRLEEAGFKMTD